MNRTFDININFTRPLKIEVAVKLVAESAEAEQLAAKLQIALKATENNDSKKQNIPKN